MSALTPVYQLIMPTVSGDADAWGGQLDTTLANIDIYLARPRGKKNAPAVGATTTLDFGLATFFEFTVSQITTLSITNVPATLPDGTVPITRALLKITNGGAFAITWPGSIVWPFETANAAPTGLAVAGVDVIELVSYDAGTTWYAMLHHVKTDPNLWPRVSVYKSSDQVLGVGTVAVSFDSERFDVGTMHDLVTNNSRLTVPANQGGTYHISAQINMTASNVFEVRKNGATLLRVGGDVTYGVLSFHEVLAAADYIELLVIAVGGNATGGITKTSFEMVRVR